MDSSFDQISPPLETLEATNEIIINVDAAPLRPSTGEKRKRERRLRSRVWQHFTKLEKRPGEREECQCNHCSQFYVCSNKSGTTHLNRHIFDGGCPKYKPTSDETTQKQLDYGNDGLEEDAKFMPGRLDRGNGWKYHEQAEQEIAQLKEENARIQQEKDALAVQKSNLEQLVVSMAAETARLVEENSKLKESSAKLQEEKQKTITREEFTRLEDQVTKLREDFERDRRGFPAAALAAITQLQKNK
ncbi:hypothetical protein MLD38_009542 [Melastoma candidum]|uniref:Uncharacterized protein n=1 Tax=Melastoma candidum TaxID=119954 RepID=A0ACB9RZC9_9MYRT|nr:hypothetical protein MLD38_009542 [Melastoma candidum]